MTNRNAWAPARPTSRLLGAIAKTAIKTAALSVALAVASGSLALAQGSKKPPAKKPAPAQAQPAQQPAPAPQAQQQPLLYSPWTKFCLPGDPSSGKKVCLTGKDARIESGMMLASAVLVEPEGAPEKMLRVTLPLLIEVLDPKSNKFVQIPLLFLPPGTRLLVDQNQNQALTAPFSFCAPNGCVAEYKMTPEFIANMKKGQNLFIQAIKGDHQPITVPLPLGDFAKAYDGPPTDPQVFEEKQKQLQVELQKRAEEARKKLEQANPAPAPGPGATAAPQGKTQ